MRQGKRRRGRRRRNRVFEDSVALAGRVSLGRLTLPQVANQAKVLSLVCLVGLSWLLFHFFSSERFFVYAVEVSGNQFVSSEEIYTQSGLDSLSIFFARPSTVSQRLQQLANIREARVTVRLPDHVSIAVTERLPQVVWESGGTRYWVDSEGVVLPARGNLEQAIVVVDRDNTDLMPGDRIDVEALHTVQQLHELLPAVTHLAYSHSTGISVIGDQGWPIVFGTSENMLSKVAIYRSLVKKLSDEGTAVEFVDLRFEGRPYYR